MKKPLPAEPVDIGALVAYEDGSVVSNTIHKDAAGTITAFAFDAGEGLSEHTAPFEAFVQIIDGAAEISIAGTPHVVKTGQLLRLPAGIPHGLRAVTRFKMLLVMMKASAQA
jgi:quercetin dioxygenase-like cupin family protein